MVNFGDLFESNLLTTRYSDDLGYWMQSKFSSSSPQYVSTLPGVTLTPEIYTVAYFGLGANKTGTTTANAI